MITRFITSPRFLSFAGHALAIGTIAILNDVVSSLSVLNLSTFWVTVIGLIVAQLIGALNNLANGEVSGLLSPR